MIIQVLLSPTREPEAMSHLIRLSIFSPKVNLQTFNGLYREFQGGGENLRENISTVFSFIPHI